MQGGVPAVRVADGIDAPLVPVPLGSNVSQDPPGDVWEAVAGGTKQPLGPDAKLVCGGDEGPDISPCLHQQLVYVMVAVQRGEVHGGCVIHAPDLDPRLQQGGGALRAALLGRHPQWGGVRPMQPRALAGVPVHVWADGQKELCDGPVVCPLAGRQVVHRQLGPRVAEPRGGRRLVDGLVVVRQQEVAQPGLEGALDAREPLVDAAVRPQVQFVQLVDVHFVKIGLHRRPQQRLRAARQDRAHTELGVGVEEHLVLHRQRTELLDRHRPPRPDHKQRALPALRGPHVAPREEVPSHLGVRGG
mmetsp:Transcript_140890/g.245483  ORF Transcript_140890/g.245483 Transcript_140890/m.245483 type:complete len:302 (+) Transcript_140890:584-1489(+)